MTVESTGGFRPQDRGLKKWSEVEDGHWQLTVETPRALGEVGGVPLCVDLERPEGAMVFCGEMQREDDGRWFAWADDGPLSYGEFKDADPRECAAHLDELCQRALELAPDVLRDHQRALVASAPWRDVTEDGPYVGDVAWAKDCDGMSVVLTQEGGEWLFGFEDPERGSGVVACGHEGLSAEQAREVCEAAVLSFWEDAVEPAADFEPSLPALEAFEAPWAQLEDGKMEKTVDGAYCLLSPVDEGSWELSVMVDPGGFDAEPVEATALIEAESARMAAATADVEVWPLSQDVRFAADYGVGDPGDARKFRTSPVETWDFGRTRDEAVEAFVSHGAARDMATLAAASLDSGNDGMYFVDFADEWPGGPIDQKRLDALLAEAGELGLDTCLEGTFDVEEGDPCVTVFQALPYELSRELERREERARAAQDARAVGSPERGKTRAEVRQEARAVMAPKAAPRPARARKAASCPAEERATLKGESRAPAAERPRAQGHGPR